MIIGTYLALNHNKDITYNLQCGKNFIAVMMYSRIKKKMKKQLVKHIWYKIKIIK